MTTPEQSQEEPQAVIEDIKVGAFAIGGTAGMIIGVLTVESVIGSPELEQQTESREDEKDLVAVPYIGTTTILGGAIAVGAVALYQRLRRH